VPEHSDVARQTTDRAVMHPSSAVNTSSASNCSVLIVEDDLVLREAITGAFEDAGFGPIGVATLDDARARIRRDPPGVLVLDLTLEGEFGADLLVELADEINAPPTVICSAFGLAGMIAARYGIELVRKPFELDDLVAAATRAQRDSRRPTFPI